MYVEQRQNRRVPRNFKVSVERASLVKVPGEPAIAGRVVEVSRRGLSFIAPCSYLRDARLRLRIEIEAGEATAIAAIPRHLVMEGLVRRCVRQGDGPDYRTGVQWPDRATAESQAWQDLVLRWSAAIL